LYFTVKLVSCAVSPSCLTLAFITIIVPGNDATSDVLFDKHNSVWTNVHIVGNALKHTQHNNASVVTSDTHNLYRRFAPPCEVKINIVNVMSFSLAPSQTPVYTDRPQIRWSLRFLL